MCVFLKICGFGTRLKQTIGLLVLIINTKLTLFNTKLTLFNTKINTKLTLFNTKINTKLTLFNTKLYQRGFSGYTYI
jgi:hypothetical protein